MTRPLTPPPGLRRAGARLPLDEYLPRLWERRRFIARFAANSNTAANQGNFLGQSWQLLNPLLNIGVYYLVFGLLLKTSRGVSNYMGFLSVGIFFFDYLSSAVVDGSKSITHNMGLVRSLHFPRAVLPVARVLTTLLQLGFSMIALVVILLLTGERPSIRWLEVIPVVALMTVFCLGIAFVTARIGAEIPDMTKLLPFIARLWMYASGMFYNVAAFTTTAPTWISTILMVNPGRVYLDLARHAMMSNSPVTPSTWLLGLGWAVGVCAVGFLYFWRGEESYGNV